MRLTIICVLVILVDFCQAQSYHPDNYEPVIDFDYEYNPDGYKRKYPYAKGYTPSFLGLVVGANVLKPQEIEVGLAYNFVETPTDFGMTGGYQLIYKRSLERNMNTIDLEMGVYGLISVGMDVNYSFSKDASVFGFKPLIGTSFYHFQVLYGYNFIRRKKQEWYDLSRHSLSVRYVLPLKASKETYYYLPDAPNYYNLPGLNKNHPVQEHNSPDRYRNRILY